MLLMKNLAELVKAAAKKMELQNQISEQFSKCQSCTLPFWCVLQIVIPVFSRFFNRQFVAEELFCACEDCILRVALPEPLSEQNAKLLQRHLERKIAKVMGRTFADVVRAKLVCVTPEYVLFRM